MRQEQEVYSQDRLGNVKREIDPIRGTDGMEEGNGLVDVEAGDVDEELVIMEIPEDSEGFHLEEIQAFNEGEEDGTFRLHDAELDDEGNVVDVTTRSVPTVVAGGTSRSMPYTGREFHQDAIVVVSEFEGSIGIGGYVDRPEYLEPETEYGAL